MDKFDPRCRALWVQAGIFFTVLALTLYSDHKAAASSSVSSSSLVATAADDSNGEFHGVTILALDHDRSCEGSSIYICRLLQRWSSHPVRNDVGDDYKENWPKFRFHWSLVVGTFVGMLGSVFGSVGGVGGGTFYVPMFELIVGFDTKTSAAMSKAMVMGASFSSVAFNFWEKHPTECRPVIDYDIAMLFQPMILLGISIGVILNVILPEWLVTVLLVTLFSNLFLTTLRRAITMWKRESNTQLLQNSIDSENDADDEYLEIPSDAVREREVQDPVTWKICSKSRMAMLVGTWLIFLSLQIVKVYVKDCSFWYWMATFLQVPLAFGVATREAFLQEKRESKKENFTAANAEENLAKGTRNSRLFYSLFGLIAGIIGGLLGIGGGSIMGPAFLELGLAPQITSATASFIMFFSSALSVAEFYLLGRLPIDFALYFTFTAVVASALGQAAIKKLILRSGKVSIIIFILSGCTGLSGLFLGATGAVSSYEDWTSGAYMGLKQLCDSS